MQRSVPASASKFFGEADFVYNGEHFRMTINNAALVSAEGVLGESMLDFVPRIKAALESGRNPMVRDISALVFGSLDRNHPGIEEEFVIDMVMSRDAAVFHALEAAMSGIEVPEDASGNGSSPATTGNRRQKKAAKAKGGAGTRSSASGAKRVNPRKTSGSKPHDPQS